MSVFISFKGSADFQQAKVVCFLATNSGIKRLGLSASITGPELDQGITNHDPLYFAGTGGSYLGLPNVWQLTTSNILTWGQFLV